MTDETKYNNLLRPYVIVYDPKPDILAAAAAGIVAPRQNARSFTPLDLIELYNFPDAATPERLTVVVVSFGGGLFGKFDAQSNMIEGDCLSYWKSLGMASVLPSVRVMPVGGAQNLPKSNDAATMENSLDVQMLGAIAPNTNIILVIAPNSMAGFKLVFETARNLKPFAVSCSWGVREEDVPSSFLLPVHAVLQEMADAGINVTCASGDFGSSNGGQGLNVDFPGSSPAVVCCGGTTLMSATNNYDTKTEETVWNNNPTTSATGGGRSVLFGKPSYQKIVTGTQRCVPDVAGNANPKTGVVFRIDGTQYVLGGTSVVSPMVCAFLVLARCTLFANQLFYECPASCFHDILFGNNGEFSAGLGFDLCTGLGSLNGRALKTAFSNTSLQITPPTLTFNNNPSPQQLNLRTVANQTKPRTVVWTSTNPKVAIVSNTGIVTPISDGTCIISCSATTQIVQVTVRGIAILAISATIIPTIKVGQSTTLALGATVPANATVRTTTWVSRHPNIAQVNQEGIVQGLRQGQALIVATMQDANAVQATCLVQVIK